MAGPTHQSLDDMNYLRYILCNWHSYAVLSCFYLSVRSKKGEYVTFNIVKIRDPWGKIKWPEIQALGDIGAKLESYKN